MAVDTPLPGRFRISGATSATSEDAEYLMQSVQRPARTARRGDPGRDPPASHTRTRAPAVGGRRARSVSPEVVGDALGWGLGWGLATCRRLGPNTRAPHASGLTHLALYFAGRSTSFRVRYR